jgi:hypothetical protein
MSTTLNLVFQYRSLVAKCESEAGLDFEEIDALATIEALFERNDNAADPTDLWSCRRRFLREEVDMSAMLRGTRLHDRVDIVDIGPGGLVCKGAPFVEVDRIVEIVFDDFELDLSYRFVGRVRRIEEADDGDCILGLEFIGSPLLVHYGQPSETTEVLERIAA